MNNRTDNLRNQDIYCEERYKHKIGKGKGKCRGGDWILELKV